MRRKSKRNTSVLLLLLVATAPFSFSIAGQMGENSLEVVATVGCPDINGNNYPEIATLVIHPDGSPLVIVQDSMTNVNIKVIRFLKDFVPTDLSVIPDINSNGVDELMVTGVSKTTSRIVNQIKDPMTSEVINRVPILAGEIVEPDIDLGKVCPDDSAQDAVLIRFGSTVKEEEVDVIAAVFTNSEWLMKPTVSPKKLLKGDEALFSIQVDTQDLDDIAGKIRFASIFYLVQTKTGKKVDSGQITVRIQVLKDSDEKCSNGDTETPE